MWFYLRVNPPKDADDIANSEDSDQTALILEYSDLCLHPLPRLICQKVRISTESTALLD